MSDFGQRLNGYAGVRSPMHIWDSAWHWRGWGDNGEALFSPSVLSWIVTGDSQGILQPTKCFFLFVVSIWKRVNFTCKSSYFKFLLKNGHTRQHQAGFLNLLELSGDVLFNLIGCRPPAPRLIGYPLPFPVTFHWLCQLLLTHRARENTRIQCTKWGWKETRVWTPGNPWLTYWGCSIHSPHFVWSFSYLASALLKTFFLLKDLIHPKTISNHHSLLVITLQLKFSWALTLEDSPTPAITSGEKTMLSHPQVYTCVSQWSVAGGVVGGGWAVFPGYSASLLPFA